MSSGVEFDNQGRVLRRLQEAEQPLGSPTASRLRQRSDATLQVTTGNGSTRLAEVGASPKLASPEPSHPDKAEARALESEEEDTVLLDDDIPTLVTSAVPPKS